MSHRPPLVLLTVLCVAAASLLLAACGGSSSPSSSTSSAATAANDALGFSKCMREHGIKNFPNPETTGGVTRFKGVGKVDLNVTPQTIEAAQKACKRFQPQGAEPNLTPQEKVAREEAVQRFARCMREHGIKVEASTQGGGIRIGIHGGPHSGGLNPESPTFQAAQKACQGLLPFKGGGPHTTGGPGAGGAGGPSTSNAPGKEGSGSGSFQTQAGG